MLQEYSYVTAKAYPVCSKCNASSCQLFLPEEGSELSSIAPISTMSDEEVVKLMLEKKYQSQNWLCDQCHSAMIHSQVPFLLPPPIKAFESHFLSNF
ncbi:hypothetical protein Ciccas_007372 [Cichlidogyrus casuarinus]|uniref:USP domain-containing protein n=1 Tax=Cichlidogyrus casuarinus TaxID=1844966 RepID=A0ABD2Q3F5_9PLAT